MFADGQHNEVPRLRPASELYRTSLPYCGAKKPYERVRVGCFAFAVLMLLANYLLDLVGCGFL
ncbi:MAG: hypothetical protein OXH83_02480 [Bryobacterales bacterium]|nr:hypothetical protein [Bryobacterales bacterium]